MHITITKQFMYQEVKKILESLFSLSELEEIIIKGVEISSLEDEHAICRALNNCYHDAYSDVDIEMKIKLNESEYNDTSPIYADCLGRLGFGDDILGVSHYCTEERVEVIRLCKTNGMRFDLIITAECSEDFPLLPHTTISEDFRRINNFWFVAIQALGKLMRKDYLIASHLAHMLIQEGLVLQMIIRDNEKNTNFHRFGYEEELEYLTILNQENISFANTPDDNFNYIARLLYSAVKSYDNLRPFLGDNLYKSRLENYLEIWSCYHHNRTNDN
jgi:hypothetical protein